MSGETQATPAAQLAAPGSAQSSVGVLGWLGFIIINFAAWGIIGTASAIFWGIGLVFCAVYTSLLVGLAVWLEKQDKEKFRQFLNLLWVLASSFVFVSGMFIAIQVIGGLDGENSFDNSGGGSSWSGGFSQDYSESTRASLLPSNASAELKAWVDASSWHAQENYFVFDNRLYFNADFAVGEERVSSALSWWGNNTSPVQVSPGLRDATSFAELDSKLFVIARDAAQREIGIWSIEAGSPSTAASAIAEVDLQNEQELGGKVTIEHLFVDPTSNLLYFKGRYYCAGCGSVATLYSSDGTASGTTDLRGDVCTTDCGSDDSSGAGGDAGANKTDAGGSGDIGYTSDKPIASFWGVLLAAILPMMLLAGFIVKTKKLPGPFLNLYFGFEGAVVILYLILGPAEPTDLSQFLKWFLTVYNTLFWVAIALWSLRNPQPSEWQDELKSWAVVFVGVSFFVMIHIDLEIPYRDDVWRWALYALLTVVQLVLSAIVSRTVPMVTGAAGLFVLSWKFAFELVEFAAIPEGEFKLLTLMAIMAVQGAGIVLASIWYASQRERLDKIVQASLRFDCATVMVLGKGLGGTMEEA